MRTPFRDLWMLARTMAALFVAFVIAIACIACASPPPPAAPLPTARTVSAIVLVNHCASLGTANAKLAEKAMNQLVEGCGAFAGGSVRFTAKLLPGGAIQFEPRGDQSDSIPICVLSHPLTHAVHLTKSCALDVELEAISMVLPKGTDAGPR